MGVRVRNVVVVAFPGVQPLERGGPDRGLCRRIRGGGGAGAGRRLPGLAGLHQRRDGLVGQRRRPLDHSRCPTSRGIDTLGCSREETGAGPPEHDGALMEWITQAAPAAGGWPPCARAPFSEPGPVCSMAGASRPTGRCASPPGGGIPRRCRWTPTRSISIDGKYWTSAGVTAGTTSSRCGWCKTIWVSTWHRTVARWLVMSCTVRVGRRSSRSPVWVRRAERSTVRACRRSSFRSLHGWRSPGPAMAAAGGHERPPLHPRLHRRSQRDAGETSSSACASRRARVDTRDDERHAGPHSPSGVGSAPPNRFDASPSAGWASARGCLSAPLSHDTRRTRSPKERTPA